MPAAFPIIEASRLAEQVYVTFGDLPATAVTLVSSDSSRTNLTVTAPANADTYVDGKVQVLITVGLRSNTAVKAHAGYTYWTFPIVQTARFETAGNGLELTFSHATNLAGITTTSFACSDVIASLRMGTGSSCVWQGNTVLKLTFGTSPTLVPGDTIALNTATGSRPIRSANGLSPVAVSSSRVLAPTVPKPPGPLVLSGPDEIDTCADLTIRATVESPRPLIYTWRCTNDDAFNRVLLALSGSAIVLGSGTPDLATLDKVKDRLACTRCLSTLSWASEAR
jgi:hypothetical protein